MRNENNGHITYQGQHEKGNDKNSISIGGLNRSVCGSGNQNKAYIASTDMIIQQETGSRVSTYDRGNCSHNDANRRRAPMAFCLDNLESLALKLYVKE